MAGNSGRPVLLILALLFTADGIALQRAQCTERMIGK